ncbi:MAG TPA: hypothetical protein VHW23_17295 [Kofleriaceae bacterium]|nr:hypothetical protein [Kofleriaceae bacterium]
MRYAGLALMACLAGCSLTSGTGGECVNDSQCGDDVCTRGGECDARTNVRAVMVKWTVDGVVASSATCGTHRDLYLQFNGTDYGDTLRFEPVVCSQGSFFVDKLPKRYQQVELGIQGGTGSVLGIDPASAQAKFDLFQ